jgi:DNA polymerase III subunit epsilon
MITIFDTETTGLPKNYKAPVTDLENWPRMIQLAWAVYDNSGKLINQNEYIIKPVGFTIPKAASDVHGISTEKAIKEGVDLSDVLTIFAKVLKETEYLVAHNISFDEKIAGAEFIRNKINNNIDTVKKICTKESTTDFCKIPGQYGYKWPSLAELYNILFNQGFDGAHDALVDVRACARCFFELKKLGVIKL